MAEAAGEELAVGCIGAGKMARGVLGGLLITGKVPAKNITVSAPTDTNLQYFRERGCSTTHSNSDVVSKCRVIFLATKPHVIPKVLREISPAVTPNHVIISMAAGVSLQTLEKVYLFAEALAEGAVKMGMPSALASRMAAQTLLGASKMILQSGEHPAKLRSDVCTPGGTTIHGLHELEKGALRATVMNAVEAATKRARDLDKR